MKHVILYNDYIKNESKLKNAILGLCSIGSLLFASCEKDDVYNLASDTRYVVKPNILDKLHKQYFNNPLSGKDKVYVWYGNQNGSGTRNGYYDFRANQTFYGERKYKGDKNPDSYPDSISNATLKAPLLAPSEVLDIVNTNDTKYNISPELKSKYKYIVLIKVHGTSKFDWSNAFSGQEVKDNWLVKDSGYALYLTNLETIKKGHLYPTFLDALVDDKSEVYPLTDNSSGFYVGGGYQLLDERPII